ncbi:MAG: DUF3153 domain-containing protein [Rhodococcus sp.]|nr:DUF3153 domain-containing protein [Rhodococcus sp. (in: high G+C Gram-positive bacteria)]
MLVPVLTGCLRVQVSMGVSSDDRVNGQIIAAAVPNHDNDPGPQLTPPMSLGGKVQVEEYREDGYVGTTARFSNLTFGEISQLSSLSDQTSGTLEMSLRRSGDIVTFEGRVDLESVPAQGADVQFTLAFPTRVGTTNGDREGDDRVTWRLPAGEVSTLRAEVRYADPNTRGFAGWAGIVGGVTLGVSVIVGALAWMARDRSARAGSGRSSETTSA